MTPLYPLFYFLIRVVNYVYGAFITLTRAIEIADHRFVLIVLNGQKEAGMAHVVVPGGVTGSLLSSEAVVNLIKAL